MKSYFKPFYTALILASSAPGAEITVVNLADSGQGSLRQAILDANAQAGKDTIRFAKGLLGTIALTSGQLSITDHLTVKGPGFDQLAVSGTHQSRVFTITGSNNVIISGLTISDGKVVGNGGGILNTGSTLILSDVLLSQNEAVATPGVGNGRGGGVANVSGGTLTVTGALITGNRALGGTGGGAGIVRSGGGIFNLGSRLTVDHTAFIGNQAIGGSGGGQARGGGIDSTNGSNATITQSSFIGNQAVAGDGSGSNGLGRGAGIINEASTLTVEDCEFRGNVARGGSNDTFGGPLVGPAGGAGVFNNDRGILFMSKSILAANLAVGGSNNTSTGGLADVGTAFGGGLNNIGTATVSDCLFEDNEARGGNGNRGDGASFQFVGTATGGAIATSGRSTSGTRASLTLNNVTIRHNRAVGGDGNTAGTFVDAGSGGAIGNHAANPFVAVSGGSEVTLRGSVIAHNQAIGGRGGEALGGGIANTLGGVVTVLASTLSHNRAQGGDNGGRGSGAGIYNGLPSTYPSNFGAQTVLTVERSTIAINKAQGGSAGEAGSSAGPGVGGGLWSGGSLAISGSTLASNMARGGNSAGLAERGSGAGGGLYAVGAVSILDTLVNYNRALGGEAADGRGGDGFGGGAYNESTASLRLENCTITRNRANEGSGSLGSNGQGIGGGVYDLGLLEIDGLTAIRENRASTTYDDIFGMVD
jgi:hypothetical protein